MTDRALVCKPCWHDHSGAEATVIEGRPMRPTAWLSVLMGQCALCGQRVTGLYSYEAERQEVHSG